jgi:hypothetical protein
MASAALEESGRRPPLASPARSHARRAILLPKRRHSARLLGRLAAKRSAPPIPFNIFSPDFPELSGKRHVYSPPGERQNPEKVAAQNTQFRWFVRFLAHQTFCLLRS